MLVTTNTGAGCPFNDSHSVLAVNKLANKSHGEKNSLKIANELAGFVGSVPNSRVVGQRHEAVNVHGYMISRSSILRVRGWNENHGIQRARRKGIFDRLRW
jgi:hypothetical protein